MCVLEAERPAVGHVSSSGEADEAGASSGRRHTEYYMDPASCGVFRQLDYINRVSTLDAAAVCDFPRETVERERRERERERERESGRSRAS